jgi:outer membrane protein assembly factor BamB
MWRFRLAVALLVWLVACSPANTDSGNPIVTPPRSLGAASTIAPALSPAASPSTAPAVAPAASPSAIALEDSWLTYQHDLARTGLTHGNYNSANIRQIWQSDPLDGQVYAQVLVSGNRAFAVTQNNTVYALDVATGKQVWSQHLGDPVPRNVLPCGNVDPTGMLSTPTIDVTRGVLYAVDYLNRPPRHELVELELADGTVNYHNPIDPPETNSLPLQQRAALALNAGNVYVPYGGLFGDCGPYHGWVISAGASDGHQRAAFQVATNRQGAIWGAPAFDSAGDVYVATGNGDSTTDFDQANAVLRLSSDLKLLDFFAPSIWADLSRRDLDLGSTGPVLLDNGSILQVGKSGVGYLLNAAQLGQIGGEVFQAPICTGGAFGGGGRSGSVVYVPCRDGLKAVQVRSAGFSVVWQGPQFSAGAPLVTDDAVWTLDDQTTSLYALDLRTGNVLFREAAGQATNPPHFLSPSAAAGRVFHSRGNVVVAFGAN